MGTRALDHSLPSTPRLARSTLTLVPLLGVHEVVFAPVTEEQARGHLRFAKLGFEIFLNSFQVLRLGAGVASFHLGPSPQRGRRATVIPRPNHGIGCDYASSFILHRMLSWCCSQLRKRLGPRQERGASAACLRVNV